MLQVSISAIGLAAVCGGVASIITATAALVWAIRRDPRGPRTEETSALARLPCRAGAGDTKK